MQAANLGERMTLQLDYREVFRYANDSMIIHDAVTGEILEANEAACRLYGRSAEELRSLPVGALSVSNDKYCHEVAIRYIHIAARSKGLFTFEWIILRSDGIEVTVEGNLKRIQGGDRPLVLAITRDISERKLAEQRLQERSRYFSELIRNSSDGVALIAGNGMIEYVSASLIGIIGVPARAARGENVFNYLHPQDARIMSTVLAKARRRAVASGTFTYRIRDRAGEWRHHEAVFKNLLHDPAFRAVLVNFRDITTRVRHEEQMREREQQLSHYARLSIAGETAAALAHEVNQPLCAAVNFFAGCRRRLNAGNPDLVEISAALDMAQQELERAGRIIQTVRQFTSKHETSRKVHSLKAVFSGISSFIEIRARQDTVDLGIRMDDDALVECDEILIQQVISNLVVNGIEAMDGQFDRERRLEIVTALRGQHIEVSVQDTGVGFPAESLEQMPATFFTTKPNGVGLGLSLCRSIVESHGGTLSFQHVRPSGTRFSFALPVL
jgi:two-component system, LuxR family, sensor kinase FixL